MGTATGMEEDTGAIATVIHSTMAATTMEIDGTVVAIIIVAIIGKNLNRSVQKEGHIANHQGRSSF